MKIPLAVYAARLLLALLLILTGVAKWIPAREAEAIARGASTLLPQEVLWMLGAFEFLLGCALLTKWYYRSAIGTLLLLVGGVGAMAYLLLAAGPEAPRCGCLGPINLSASAHIAILCSMLIPAWIILSRGSVDPLTVG